MVPSTLVLMGSEDSGQDGQGREYLQAKGITRGIDSGRNGDERFPEQHGRGERESRRHERIADAVCRGGHRGRWATWLAVGIVLSGCWHFSDIGNWTVLRHPY